MQQEQNAAGKAPRTRKRRDPPFYMLLLWIVIVIVVIPVTLSVLPIYVSILFAVSIFVLTAFSFNKKVTSLSKKSIASYNGSLLHGINLTSSGSLSFLALWRYNFLDGEWIIIFSIFSGVFLSFLIVRPWRTQYKRRVGFLTATILGFSIGPMMLSGSTVAFLNELGGPEVIAIHRVTISEKSAYRGTKSGTSYRIKTEAPTAIDDLRTFHVPLSLYQKLNVGDDACIHVWQGMLRARGYFAGTCD